MGRKDSFTVVEKLLISALEMVEKGKTRFSAEDLVVCSWKNFPDTFGLAGYTDERGIARFPDSNRVFAEIMGSKPIRKRGYLIKVGTKMYQLTEAGVGHAKLVSHRFYDAPQSEVDVDKIKIERKGTVQLKRLLSSKALEKFNEERFDDVTFFDACAFWGISPRSSAIAFEGRTANLIEVVSSALKDSKGEKRVFEHGGRPYTYEELDGILKLHEFLLKRFENQLETIKGRTDERKT